MSAALVQASYVIAALLFIASLAGLSRHETSRAGNAYGVIGMVIALLATIAYAVRSSHGLGLALIVAAMAVGGAIGVNRALRVEMTGMPQLVAMLHSFVGLAAVLVGYNAWLEAPVSIGAEGRIHSVEVFLGVFIGAVTLTGSIVAFLKLSGRIPSKPLMLPGRHWMNLAALVVTAGLLWWFVASDGTAPLVLMTVIALIFGWHLVASIGGGDMPVVVSMLNSYSGWAAAAAG
ncbi:MAG: NAD(P)(+) transhydrogenase (Re/Si-specific) subunit beta, partial [Lapillicoccus sp.]